MRSARRGRTDRTQKMSQMSSSSKVSWLAAMVVGAAFAGGCAVATPDGDGAAPGDRGGELDDYLDRLLAPAAIQHRFTLDSGDRVECIDIDAQPAARGLAAAGLSVQRAPSKTPAAASLVDRSEALVALPGDRDPDGNLRACPDDTVPVLAIDRDRLRGHVGVAELRRKAPGADAPALPSAAAAAARSRHQYAWTERFGEHRGAGSRINVWYDEVARSTEFALSQIWVSRGDGAELETVEVGVQQYPLLYGDDLPRLFVYFTPDGYASGGCYNLTCGGFVQVSSRVLLGGPVAAHSAVDGAQVELKALWYKDGDGGDWWLQIGGTWVGYYPRDLFDGGGLRDRADYVGFGGEIIDADPDDHTETDMGSGAFPSAGWRRAAYQRDLRSVDLAGDDADLGELVGMRTDAGCYDIEVGDDPQSWGRYFFFGGPGYGPSCR